MRGVVGCDQAHAPRSRRSRRHTRNGSMRLAHRTLGAACALVLVGTGVVSCSHESARALLWHDEFDGSAGAFPDSRIWSAQLGAGGWGNNELQTYTDRPENVALDGEGHLVLSARSSGPPERTTSWTSARINTSGRHAIRYGRFEVHARVPSGVGIWPAAWTLGQNIDQIGWPRCGEIDLIESIGNATTALQTVHGPREDSTNWQRQVRTKRHEPLSENFHTYSADWTEDRIVFEIDGKITGTVEAADIPSGGTWPFTGPQFVVLNVAVGGELPGPPNASTPKVASMVVDWVRVYAPR
jgi:beta-glucanase (GH16 family)